MIYTVTFNPSIDYIVNVDNFMTGVVNRTSKEIIFPGGKGINVSMVLKNLGEESTALGFMAGFTGDAITRLLQEKGVTADFIHVTEGLSRINVKLRAQTETEINGQGPKIASEDIRKLYGKLDALQDGDTLVLAGSIPDTMPESMYMDIMEHLQNKKLNIVVDATRDLLMNVLAYHPFLIKPNNHELGEIFHTVINDKDDVVTYAKRMQEKWLAQMKAAMEKHDAKLSEEERTLEQKKSDMELQNIIQNAEREEKQTYRIVNTEKYCWFKNITKRVIQFAQLSGCNIKIETLSSMDAVIKMQTGCIWLLSDGEAAQQDKRVIQELIDQAEHVYIGNSEREGKKVLDMEFVFRLYEKLKKTEN